MQFKKLPLLVTRKIVIFPDQEITLEVGRPLSVKSVLRSSEKYENYILIACQKEPLEDNPGFDNIFNYGTLAKIENMEKFEDGSYKIIFKGLERVQLTFSKDQKLDNDIPFLIRKAVSDKPLEEKAYINQINKFMESNWKIQNPNSSFDQVLKSLEENMQSSQVADAVASFMHIDFLKKQIILEEENVLKRLNIVLEYLNDEKTSSELEEVIAKKVKNKLNDQQKDFFLRERLKAIKEELGEGNSKDNEADKFKKLVNENPYPEYIKERLLEEIKKFENIPSISGESSVIRGYIEWLLYLPWWQTSEDNNSLSNAEATLNSNHYGLKKVKERIIEYLAVKAHTNSLKGPIICLAGPPGTGKTSLAKSIADALERKFMKISLGGVKDEAEIRGHRKTYLGAMPGKIIQAMKKSKTINPVILLDEIDKMSSDYKGDPTSAMLEVLDPEQNQSFQDHYLEENYDLSKVMFIATANYLQDIPAPLRDRMEIINLSSYTEMEKVKIAQNYLVNKTLKNSGLKPNMFKITKENLLYIIRHYTMEAGVRELQKLLDKMARKIVVMKLNGKVKKTFSLNKKNINIFLGTEIFDFNRKSEKSEIGVVTGLAWTAYGGDILPIEVTFFPGKGNLILTGQQRKVMKESVNIALGYVKTNAKKFKINLEDLEKSDIHVHVPDGATPKDGPSAGITFTTALISAFTKRAVSKKIAMTGEISLTGKVLPIGGLKEKSISAVRSGIGEILIPKKNIKDLKDIPESIKKALNIIPVDKYHEVYEYIFNDKMASK